MFSSGTSTKSKSAFFSQNWPLTRFWEP